MSRAKAMARIAALQALMANAATARRAAAEAERDALAQRREGLLRALDEEGPLRDALLAPTARRIGAIDAEQAVLRRRAERLQEEALARRRMEALSRRLADALRAEEGRCADRKALEGLLDALAGRASSPG